MAYPFGAFAAHSACRFHPAARPFAGLLPELGKGQESRFRAAMIALGNATTRMSRHSVAEEITSIHADFLVGAEGIQTTILFAMCSSNLETPVEQESASYGARWSGQGGKNIAASTQAKAGLIWT